MERFAPAKINLCLHVTGRRGDGYHLLESLVVFAGVGDIVCCDANPGTLTLAIDGPFAATLSADDGNLVLKAARGLAQAAGIEPAARLGLTKRLPVASGVGGGSSDAAAALRGLAALWEIGLDEDRLRAIGLELGADVPVCLFGRPAWFSGIGERLTTASALPPAWLVLVNPGIALSTREVFAARTAPFSVPEAPFGAIPDVVALAEALGARRNDLESAAIRLAPPIADALTALRARPGCLLARMSGSGATCFGLFGDEDAAEDAAAAIAADHPHWWCVAAPMLG